MAYIGNPPFDVRSFGSTKFEYTATAGQTAFTGLDDNNKTLAFTDGHIEVYVNGVLMDNDDFSTSGGNTVTLASAAAADDIITVTAVKTNVPNTDYVPASGGTFTGNVTVDGTLTSDGLTVDGVIKIDKSTPTFWLYENDVTDHHTFIRNVSGSFRVETATDAGAASGKRLSIDHATGDISFYEDTGTTPKFFWDASAVSLGIGTTSPSYQLDVQGQNAGTDCILRVKTLGTQSYSDAFLYLETAGSGISGIAFGDAADNNVGLINYDHGDDSLYIRTNATEAMRIDSSGNVGIGTSSTASKLHVYDSTNTSASTTGTTLLTLDNYVGTDLSQQKSFIDFRLFDDNTNETPQVRIGAEVGDNGDANDQNKEGSGAFIVYTNNADTTSGDAGSSLVEKFRIDYTGNAGLNVSAPASDVSGSAKVFQINHSNLPSLRLNHTGAASWEMISGGGGQLAWYDDGTERMKINSSGNLQLGQSTAGGRLAVNGMGWFHGAEYQQLTLASATSGYYAGIRFCDHISGGSGAAISTQRGYIRWTHSDGNTQSISGRAGNASYVVGSTENINMMSFQYSMADDGYGTNRGELYWSSGTNLTLYSGSDARLKENVASIPTGEAKQKVLAMNPVSYNFIDDTEEVKTNNLGFIAQELKDIVPEVVKGSPEDDEMMSVNYAGLTPVLAAALKDALTEIENLKTRIEALENT